MQEFNDAKKTDTGSMMIMVWDHKTLAKYGPAKVNLSMEEYNWLKLFATRVRPQVEPKVKYVLLSWQGQRMSSGSISRRLHVLWEKAGVFADNPPIKNLCCNIIRKSTSTGIRERTLGGNQKVADLMAHDMVTAKKHYYIREQEKNAQKGSEIVRKHFYSVRSPPIYFLNWQNMIKGSPSLSIVAYMIIYLQ